MRGAEIWLSIAYTVEVFGVRDVKYLSTAFVVLVWIYVVEEGGV